MRWALAQNYYMEAVSRNSIGIENLKRAQLFHWVEENVLSDWGSYICGGRVLMRKKVSRGRSQEICRGEPSSHCLNPDPHIFGWNSKEWVKNQHKALGQANAQSSHRASRIGWSLQKGITQVVGLNYSRLKTALIHSNKAEKQVSKGSNWSPLT